MEAPVAAANPALPQPAINKQTIGSLSWYGRNIEPLTSLDYTVLTGGIASVFPIMIVSYRIFGKGIVPLSICISSLSLYGAYWVTRYRLNRHFDREACSVISDIQTLALKATPSLPEIQDKINLLVKSEFSHRESMAKDVQTQFDSLKSIYSTLDLPGKNIRELRKTFIVYLNQWIIRLGGKVVHSSTNIPQQNDDGLEIEVEQV